MLVLAVGMGLAGATVHAAETVIPIEGEVPDDGLDHFFVPFDVPEGTVEIEVRHDDQSTMNVLDWGLQGPDGFRGWGGGNEEPAIVGIDAASRSYTPGSIAPGQWNVIVGKARIDDPPGTYAIEVVLRDEATLQPQGRTNYVHANALSDQPGWYAGDFHVHSVQSGDARPALGEIATFARERGLDFVVISDHNVHTAQDFFALVQPDHEELLLVPGVEFTTYAGHANALGATQWVDHKLGQPGVTIEGAIAAYHDQGALVSINHPTLDIGNLCIGCAWDHDVDPASIDAVEVANGGLEPFGAQFTPDAIEYWDALCAQGHHIAAIGGSDDHKAGVDLNMFQSPIGDATTLVYAQRLDVPSILEGVRNGRTVVKLQGPGDPTVMFEAVEPIDGDTIRAPEVTLRATILGGMGEPVRLVQNAEPWEAQTIDADPFEVEWTVSAPTQGQDRYRVEVFVDGRLRVITSHLWVEDGPAPETGTGTGTGATESDGDATTGTGTGTEGSGSAGEAGSSGCGCTTTGRHRSAALPWLGLIAALRPRARRLARRASSPCYRPLDVEVEPVGVVGVGGGHRGLSGRRPGRGGGRGVEHLGRSDRHDDHRRPVHHRAVGVDEQ